MTKTLLIAGIKNTGYLWHNVTTVLTVLLGVAMVWHKRCVVHVLTEKSAC